MATLKDHQQAMVDLLASGSGIPASASRLAHAMHDVLIYINGNNVPLSSVNGVETVVYRPDATTPGLNDKALAADVEACRPKDTMFDRARAAERRVKELENTVKQLRASNAKLREDKCELEDQVEHYRRMALPEQAAPYKSVPFAPVKECKHKRHQVTETFMECLDCGVDLSYELQHKQAGCRKDDMQVCDHPEGRVDTNIGFCSKCGNFL